MAETRFISAIDVLFSRGNRLFGEAGQHGEAQMPPWPSVVAGAIRSRMLADAGVDFVAFGREEPLPDADFRDALGTPAQPGNFRVAWFSIARRENGAVEPLFALPADLIADENGDGLCYLKPQPLPDKLRASVATEYVAVLRQVKPAKPEAGLWLTGKGLAAYLRGQRLSKQAHTVRSGELWKTDPRIGIALDPEKRSAADGRLYTTDGVAPTNNVGFLASVCGADGLVPTKGLLRLSGDGRGARVDVCDSVLPGPDWDLIAAERKFRFVLAAPGLFEQGWRPSGIQNDHVTWKGPDDVTARLVCAAVSRAQVVSGWDLAKRQPKAALRAAPAGSVYWFESQETDGAKLVAALRKLAEQGFGCLSCYPDRARLAEGFNNVMVANWADA